MIPIDLPSIRNARDLGGTEAAGGRRILPGRLIRAADLSEAVEADVRVLRERHGLSAVIDLRTDEECEKRPDRTYGVRLARHPILRSLTEGVTHERGPDRPFPDMGDLYRVMMRDQGVEGFRSALSAIFAQEEGAVLWHCTEGKDRCGMTAALVLEALRVPREAILADYLETNRTSIPRARKIYERLLPLRGEAVAKSVYLGYIADERYLRAAWDAMGRDYLHDTLGFDEHTLEAFRARVLAPAGA